MKVDSIRNPQGIWINSQVFREEALAFKKNGYYCPDLPGSYGWIEYWDEQLKRCTEGYSVGGVSITGHHYFYLNFIEIMLVDNTDNERIAKKISESPGFWDGDYEYFWALDIARNGATREFVDSLKLECKIEDAYLNGGYHMIVGKARRKGYQQPYSETIITPNGKTTMGNIKVGDYVNTPSGKAKVLEKYEQGECDVYEITLQDGRKIRCGKEHLWNIIEFRGSRKTVDTEFFLNKKLKRGTKGKEYYSYYLPQTNEVKFDKKEDIPINPYLLGLLIGDGSVNRSTCLFSTVDKELLISIKDIIGDDYSITKTNNTGYQYRISYLKESNKNPILSELKNLNLRTTALHKFIPDIYKYSSIEDRYELVRGLMDTDGSITKNGSCNFVNTSEQLIDDLAFVLRSLGIRCKKSKLNNLDKGFSKNQAWQLIITTDKQIFKLKRKADLIRKRNYNLNKIAIVNVKKLDYKEQSACILIDSNDHLYLTTDFVVTHNSYKNAAICANMLNIDVDTLVIIGAYEKKFLYPTGTMGMTSKYLDHINAHTAWTKAREFVDKQDHKKLSYRRIKDGATIEEGFKSEVMALTFQDNPDAARGKDARLILFEESGKFPNLINSYMATKETLGAGKFSTGQMIIFGCVCAGTKVYTNEGKVVNIEDLKQEDGIIGYNGEQAVQQNINWFKPPIEKECYRIGFSDNSYIECSDDHPLLLTKRKFIKNKKKRLIYQEAKHIEINDQVITPSEIPLFGNKDISYARELGLMIGDGNYSLNTTPSLSISETEILEYIVNKYDLKYSHYYKTKNNNDYYQYSLPKLKDKLIDHKMYGQIKENKRLPYDIHTFNKTSVANLLAGYFDADGNVYYNKKKEIVRIVLTSISYNLLEEVKYQLLKFGIHCNIYKENRNSIPSEEYKGQKDYVYRLYINKQIDIEIFKNNISLLVKTKREKLKLIKHSKYNSFNGIFEINPLNNKEGYFNSELIKNLRYKTVTSIEHIGKKEVYNLNCGPNHNYISNGLITRQTGGDMESGTVDFARMFYNPTEFDLMPFNNIWDHNATGTTCGFFHPDYKNLEGYYDNQGNSFIKEAVDYELNTRNELRKNSSSSATLQKRVQERPHRPSEAFLVVSVNDFPIQELQEQLNKVKRENLHLKKGQPVLLKRTVDNRVECSPILDDKLSPVWEYTNKQDDVTGCPVIYEYPVPNAPEGLYKIGYDPYRQNQATNSTSLGAVYVYKGVMRGQPTYDCIVASYIGRPNTSDDFHRILEMLSELYGAEIGFENEVTSVKSYFERRRKLHLLALQPDAVINANIKKSKVARTYGIHMVEKIKDAGEKYIKQWLLTEKSIDENENVVLNLQTIYDPGLLEELILYNRKGNFDRVMAFMILQMYLENEVENKTYESNNYDVIKEMETFANNLFRK